MMHLRNKFGAKMLPTKECVIQSDTEGNDKGISLGDTLDSAQESKQEAIMKLDI